MEAQIPGGAYYNSATTYQEQAPAAQFINEGDNSGSSGEQESRYYMAC